MDKNTTGDTARIMAAAPLSTPQEAPKPVKAKNGIFAVIGSPSFISGDGRKYPRTEGWGNNKKPHSQGGTNETAAFVTFKPFQGSDIALEGRIYLERFTNAQGENKRVYSVSLPFLKAEKRDAKGRQLVETAKIGVRELYRAWQGTDAAKTSAKEAAVTASADKWEETDAAE